LKVSGKKEAVHFDISPNTFDRLVSDGLMPKPVQIYGRKVWDRFAIDRAFEALQGLPASPQAGAWD
jgi:predicted DNA-binding transcriptional regulator AlpA